MRQFRILSLDGGGIKGTFTASVLNELEESTGKRVVDHFDLIAGTSTGGLIALALGLGMPAKQILEFYMNRGPEIFHDKGRGGILRTMRHAIRPKYSQQHLQQTLTELFQGKYLGESSCRLVIPSYDCNAGKVRLFKTAHHSRFNQDHRMMACSVAMATAAAPTYFPAFSAFDGQAYLDGGIWANCPIVIGLQEAAFVLGNSPFDLDVLSIGTTSAPHDVSWAKQSGGFLTWNTDLVNVQMRAQIEGALAQAQVMTGKRVMRIDAVVRPSRFTLDDSTQVESLRGLGKSHALETIDEVAGLFFEDPVTPFKPCHSPFTRPPAGVGPRPKVARRRRRKSLGVAKTGIHGGEHRVVDISVSGVLLETDREIPVGHGVSLELVLEDGTRVNAHGEVVRVQRPNWGVSAGVGIAFTEMQPEARLAIDHYVETQPLVPHFKDSPERETVDPCW